MQTEAIYGAAPIDLGPIDISPVEMMFWLYCPVKLAGSLEIVTPPNLAGFAPIVDAVKADCSDRWLESNVYLTAKTLHVTPENRGNRPGWHSDGFLTDDLNYIWSDTNPTLFWVSDKPVAFSSDHLASMAEMELVAEADRENHCVFPDRHLLRLDQSIIHRVSDFKEPAIRTFVKVSVSKHEYRLSGNSVNHALKTGWKYESRAENRNAPEVLSALTASASEPEPVAVDVETIAKHWIEHGRTDPFGQPQPGDWDHIKANKPFAHSEAIRVAKWAITALGNTVPTPDGAVEALRRLVERAQQIVPLTYVNWHDAAKIALSHPADGWRDTIDANRIHEVMDEEGHSGTACGWQPCTGCHETNEGAETGLYPYSKAFGCHVGAGCGECGGIGVIWHHYSATDLADMQADGEYDLSHPWEWQPIESAPKDGTEILVYGPHKNGGTYRDVQRWPKNWSSKWPVSYMAYAAGEPLGWMPLPAAPAAKPEGE